MAATATLDPSSASLIMDAMSVQALLGAGLPYEAERSLAMAGANYHLEEVAEQHLNAALDAAPDHAAVLIGLYRFYFYKNRLKDALGVARLCLDKAARDNGLALDWRRVQPADADFSAYEAALPRFYLFTLKAYAYLSMRLGDLAEGERVITKLLELDPTDKIGVKVLRDVLDRLGAEDDD